MHIFELFFRRKRRHTAGEYLPLEGLDGKYAGIGFSGVSLIVLLALATCLISYYFLRKRVERKIILMVLLLFLVGYGARLLMFLRSPLMYGIDGPWYVGQVKSIVETGAPSEAGLGPLVMYFASGASVFVNDATLGIKITQAFFSALLTLTTWLLTFYITKNKLASFVAALLTTFFIINVGMSDVLRNTGALAFLPLFYLFFLKFINGEGREWTIKTLKIRGKKFGLTLNTNLVLSLLIFLVILGSHFLTAGFAVMTVVAYVAFFTGYRRKIPLQELKFVAVLGILVLIGMAASGTIRDKIVGTSNSIATSELVPADMFPFSAVSLAPPGAAGADPAMGMASYMMFVLPFILIALPAMWFALRHRDRRYLLFTATIPLALLCSQNWIVNSEYSVRFLIMMYTALFILWGITIWRRWESSKKAAAAVLAFGFGFFSLFPFVAFGATVGNTGGFGPMITLEDWTELRSIGMQLPENSVVTTSEGGLFYWGPLLFDKESGSTFFLQGGGTLGIIAEGMKGTQKPDMISLAVVRNDLVAGENLESFGLEFYDNVRTENYCVLKLAGNPVGTLQFSDTSPPTSNLPPLSDSNNTLQFSDGSGEGPGGLPEYPGAINLQWSKENIDNTFYQWHMNLSQPEISAAVYSTTADYTVVMQWYREQMPGLGWTKTWDDENPGGWGDLNYTKGNDGAMIHPGLGIAPGGTYIVLVEGPAEMLGWSTGSTELAATNEIRFNHNPLFAFILLPIELVQGLYGTAVYGILKLVIAIPLSVGLIGFLIGLCPILASRCRKWRKAPRKAGFFKRRVWGRKKRK